MSNRVFFYLVAGLFSSTLSAFNFLVVCSPFNHMRVSISVFLLASLILQYLSFSAINGNNSAFLGQGINERFWSITLPTNGHQRSAVEVVEILSYSASFLFVTAIVVAAYRRAIAAKSYSLFDFAAITCPNFAIESR